MLNLSPIPPIIGFKNIPVKVDIELIVPIRVVLAPKFFAKKGNANLPVIYEERLINSADHKFRRVWLFFSINFGLFLFIVIYFNCILEKKSSFYTKLL